MSMARKSACVASSALVIGGALAAGAPLLPALCACLLVDAFMWPREDRKPPAAGVDAGGRGGGTT